MEGKHTVIKPSDLQYGAQQSQIDPHSAFGVAFKGRYHNKDVAIKKTRLQGDNDYFILSSWADEVAKLERFADQNLAKFLGVVEEKGHWALVQEWVDGHDLRAAMKQYPDGAPPHFAGQTGLQMAEGLSYLHANGILHLNLSPGNVIYNSSNTTLKLRDFGLRTFKLACFAKETTHGNPRYVAVEVMMRQHDNISPASDVWSWGFVMYEVATGSTVFGSFKPPQISRKIWEAGDRPDLEDVQDPSLSKIISQCWSKSAASRPSVAQLINVSQTLSRSGGPAPHKEHKPALFEPNTKYDSHHAAAAPKSKVDESLDDMLNDLDKML